MSNRLEVDGTLYDENATVDQYAIFNAQRWMRSQWHNTRDTLQLLEWNLDETHNHGNNRACFLNNQFVLTPGVGSPSDIIQLLMGQGSLSPVSLASNLYRKDVLNEFFREHADEPFNFTSMDFCDLSPALVSFLIVG